MKQLHLVRAILFLGLILFANHLFAKNQALTPSIEYRIQELYDVQKLPNLNWIIEENTQTLTVDDLMDNQLKDAQLIDLSSSPLFQFRPHRNYWLKLKLHSAIDASGLGLVIKHDNYCWPYEYTFSNVEAYQLKETGMKVGYSGTSRIASARDFPKKINPSIITLNFDSNETQEIWVKLSRAEICNIVIDLELSTDEYINRSRPMTALLGFHTFTFGAIVVLFFMALLLYVWFREKVYLWFMLFQFFLLLTQLGIQYRNEVFNLFFQNNPRLFVLSISILAPIWMTCLLQFGRIYINTKSKFPLIHKIFTIAIGLFLLGAAFGNFVRIYEFSFKDYSFNYITQPLISISILSIFLLLIALAFTKDKFAKMYSLAIMLPFASILYVIITMQLFDGNRTDVSVIISMGMVATMTLALAFRFRTVMAEKETALKDKLNVELENSQQLQKINEASNKFVPQTFLNFLGKKNILEASLGDYVEKKVTVLFSDIRDYTTLSEGMSPKEAFRFVTAYNQRMGPIIHRHDGFINQYLGDGIMAIFPKNTSLTLKGAIAMQHTLLSYNQERVQKNKIPIKMGIGLHTGSLIMGIIGDDERLDAATISDTVNVASRIESLTKYYGASILLSEICYQDIDRKDYFNFRFLGKVVVKGKEQPVGLYECIDGDLKDQFNLKKQTLATFEKALQQYFNKEFKLAIKDLKSIIDINPKDKAAQLFLKKAILFSNKKIKDDWTGEEKMTKK